MDSYSWDFGDGSNDTVENPSHAYSGPGTYTVRLTASKDGCFGTCKGSVDVMFADCSWTSCCPVCNGTKLQFHASSGMDTYLWDFGDGSSSTEEDPSHLYSAPGTYSVTLAVTKGICSHTCKGSADVVTCSLNPPEYNSAVSYEDPLNGQYELATGSIVSYESLLKSQYGLITSLGNLLKNTTLQEDREE
jgi:PKD repeat protein